jgi:quercetin dioxygenase-like cupin family protein
MSTERQRESRCKPLRDTQTLAGHIRLKLSDRTVELPAGQLLVLDQCVSHDVEAEEDSAFLLTLSWPGDEADACKTD